MVLPHGVPVGEALDVLCCFLVAAIWTFLLPTATSDMNTNVTLPRPLFSPVAVDGGASPSLLRRGLYAVSGLLFIAIAIVGVALPGIPTTGPLLAASFLLAKSNPAWERKLLGLRIFRPYRPFLEGTAAIPRRARLWALAWMWGSILFSCYCLAQTGSAASLLICGTLALGAIGTVALLRFRRAVPRLATSPRKQAPATFPFTATQASGMSTAASGPRRLQTWVTLRAAREGQVASLKGTSR